MLNSEFGYVLSFELKQTGLNTWSICFEEEAKKAIFFLHCVGITSAWTSHPRPSLSTAFSNPIRSMSPLHMQERHQHTGDGGDRGRRLIGADLKRDLMTGINLDFRGQVGLTDAQQAAGLRENRLIERWVIPCDQLSMQSGLGVWNERGESYEGDNVSRNQCYFLKSSSCLSKVSNHSANFNFWTLTSIQLLLNGYFLF